MADNLERARRMALDALAALPSGTQLYVGGVQPDSEFAVLMLGLGMCVGKGHAVYSGDDHYQITANGRAYAVEQD